MALMSSFPPDADSQVTLANWRQAPFNRWAFHHVRELIPSAAIPRGDGVWELSRSPVALERLQFKDRDGARHRLGEALARTCTDGMLVLAGGQIVHERYDHGLRPQDPHVLMSVSKSLVAALAGILIDRGVLAAELPLADLLPELEGSGYADASLQQLLDMRVGVDFDEDYEATEGAMIEYRIATGWDPARPDMALGDLRGFVAARRARGRHGGPFKYVSPNTDLLGWLVERSAGRRLPELLSETIWAPMGAEFDAYVTLDRLGAPRAAGGLCVTLRDLGRFGQMMLQHGIARGHTVLPAWWVSDTTTGGDEEAFRRGDLAYLLPGGRYRNQWYQVGDELGAYLALGIHGQFLYVAPAAGVVVARLASHPLALDAASETLMIEAFGAIARELA